MTHPVPSHTIFSALFLSMSLFSQHGTMYSEEKTPSQAEAPAPQPILASELPTTWINDQSVTIEPQTPAHPKTLQYDIAVGTIPVTSEDKKHSVGISYIAYFAKPTKAAQQQAARPVAFCFNGGPGSSSVWLHLGALGPQKISLPTTQWLSSAPRLENNPMTLLQVADLVFIDPVGTGFSQSSNGSDEKKFFGVDEDISSLAQFLQTFFTKFHLWNSPKFLIGESYGALRITGIASELLNRYFISFQGLALISGTMDLRDMASVDMSDYAALIPLPTYAATARHFNRLRENEMQKPLTEFLNEVEAFCINQYAPALLVGDALEEQEREKIADKLALYTGLSKEFVLERNLRIAPETFAKTLLKHEDLVLGRFDSRYTGYKAPGTDPYWIDPSLFAVAPAFTAAINTYLDTLLGQHVEKQRYIVLNESVQLWNWTRKSDQPGLGYANTVLDTRITLMNNPNMQIFVAAGMYDLALPYFGQELSIYRLLLPKALRENIIIKRYRGGHMMYLDAFCLKKLLSDIQEYIRNSSQPTPIETRATSGQDSTTTAGIQ